MFCPLCVHRATNIRDVNQHSLVSCIATKSEVSKVLIFYKPCFTPCILSFSYVCYICGPSHSPWFDHSDDIAWELQIVKLLLTHFSQVFVFHPPPSVHMSSELPFKDNFRPLTRLTNLFFFLFFFLLLPLWNRGHPGNSSFRLSFLILDSR
jgi:hypothetical protein